MKDSSKKDLISQICLKLENDVAALKEAALQTHAAATGEQSRPENQYDTRAIEASYLAGAQAKRVAEIEASIQSLRYMEVRDFASSDSIGVSALIELEGHGKKSTVFLVSPPITCSIKWGSKTILVITLASPLGQALLNLEVGDIAVVERGSEAMEYEVLSLI